jgi:hypothetical protein
MMIPSRQQADTFLREAGSLNPTPWVRHSILVAQAAQIIASHHPRLDPDVAYILGYLHDIGRREGRTDLRHTLDGYRFLCGHGFDDAARICLTHGFIIKDPHITAGQWDCSGEELRFVEGYLASIEYNEYDRLLQLCDLFALCDGFCLIEKRLVDVALRRGVNEHSVPRWKAMFALQADFECIIGRPIYSLLPGVVEGTFGFTPGASKNF